VTYALDFISSSRIAGVISKAELCRNLNEPPAEQG
jgi:hypothetical protein